jgi:uncharacterized membrane protein (DUF106 family)
MWGIASALNGIFDLLMAPFQGMHPLVGLIVISVITGIVMLLIFGKTSNQKAIRVAKGRLKAHIVEIWLFRNDLVQMLIAIARVLSNTGRYFAHSLRPLVFIFVPVLAIMVMLGVRYELRPFKVDETAVVSVHVDNPAWTQGGQVQLVGSDDVEVVSPALRIPSLGDVEWKIRAARPGWHELVVRTPGGETSKRILVAAEGQAADKVRAKIASARGRVLSGSFLLFPTEPPLPAATGIRSIEVKNWPHRDLTIFGLGVHWLIVFFAVSLVAGFAVKDIFGVEV